MTINSYYHIIIMSCETNSVRELTFVTHLTNFVDWKRNLITKSSFLSCLLNLWTLWRHHQPVWDSTLSKIICNDHHSRLCKIVPWHEYIKNYYLTLFFLLLLITLTIIRKFYCVNVLALTTVLTQNVCLKHSAMFKHYFFYRTSVYKLS